MLNTILAALLLLLAICSVTARKVYDLVPKHELKRQAAARNHLASQLYPAVAYGASLRALLWLLTTFSLTGGLVLVGRTAPWWVSFIVAVLMVWLLFSWLPNTKVVAPDVLVTRALNGPIVWLLAKLDRPLQLLMRLVGRAYKARHSGLYELDDLMDLLDLQATQSDSRISTEEIDLIRHVLNFGNLKVRDVLRPRDQVKAVSASDAVGPILLDELHASGQSSFPVKKTPRSKEIIGTLHVGDVGIHSKGTVADHVSPGVTYITDEDNLADALHAFYQTRRQLFVVVDAFEEYVGVLTLEDILYQLVDKPIVEGKTAAPHDAESSQSDETVVE